MASARRPKKRVKAAKKWPLWLWALAGLCGIGLLSGIALAGWLYWATHGGIPQVPQFGDSSSEESELFVGPSALAASGLWSASSTSQHGTTSFNPKGPGSDIQMLMRNFSAVGEPTVMETLSLFSKSLGKTNPKDLDFSKQPPQSIFGSSFEALPPLGRQRIPAMRMTVFWFQHQIFINAQRDRALLTMVIQNKELPADTQALADAIDASLDRANAYALAHLPAAKESSTAGQRGLEGRAPAR